MEYTIEKYDLNGWLVMKHATNGGGVWRVLFDDKEMALQFLIEHLKKGDGND